MKTVDPVNLFAQGGISILTAQDQSARIAELEAENARMRRLLKIAVARIRRLDGRNSSMAEMSRDTLH